MPSWRSGYHLQGVSYFIIMATNKKSVLLYCDLIHSIDPLTDEEAGKLFKHYLRYINDQNPCAEDRLTALLFEPIKQNLKRDLKKWESIIDKRKVAGAIGGKQKVANAKSAKQKVANVAVTDTVTDTVTVKEINIPTVDEFLEFCMGIKEIDYNLYRFSLVSKYEAWVENGWKDGNNTKIKNWKSKIKNTIPFLKPEKTKTYFHNLQGTL